MALKVFILLCTFNAVLASGYAQQKISIHVKDQSITEVLNYLRKNTDYQFVCKKEIIQGKTIKELKMVDASLTQILDQVLLENGLDYEVLDEMVIVRRAEVLQQQVNTIQITGTVTDEAGHPLPGVTVLLKGTTIGTATNKEGYYKLPIPAGKASVLIFTFVGMETQEIPVKESLTINVRMKEFHSELDDVVVTGYQTVNRRDMVGSFTTLKMEDIINPAYTTIDQMLQGQVPGVIVTSTSARVGHSPKISIRGTSTLIGNQSPLWVVDGIIQDEAIPINSTTNMIDDLKNIVGNEVSWLNPNDIETITFLKDASATAIYGSRASNGVIVIQTKRPKAGRTSINYSFNLSIAPRPHYGLFNVMNSQERIEFSQEAYNAGIRYAKVPIGDIYSYEGLMELFNQSKLTQPQVLDYLKILQESNTDWFDLLTRTTYNTSHNLSVGGGSDRISYNVSFSYADTKGQEIGNDSKRFTTRGTINMQLHDKLRLSVVFNGGSTTTKTFAGINPYGYALNTSRALPAYNKDGSLAYYQMESTYSFNRENLTLAQLQRP